ncbi:MAG: hypothetical protein IPJ58_03300 [Ardenticatenia bacterium]|nr:hypothetical protein [Ardenticatenia bacterium]
MDEQFLLHSPLSPTECESRLRQALKQFRYRGPERPPELRHVTGSATDPGGFDLMWAGDRYGELPRLALTLAADGSGTRLDCRYHLSGFRWFFRIFEVALVAMFTYYSWLLISGEQVGLRSGGTGSPWLLWLITFVGVALMPLNRLLLRRRRPGVMAAERAFVEWAVQRREPSTLTGGSIRLDDGPVEL